MVAVASVALWRVMKLQKELAAQEKKEQGDEEENGIEASSLDFVKRFVKAGQCFAEHEGLGMLLYFSISFALDSTTVFLAPAVGSYCEADKLAALYTAALLTFLPNAVYSLYLQKRCWDEADWRKRVVFVIGVIGITCVTFYLRLKLVFDAGWIAHVQRALSGLSDTMRAAVASSVPPVVDVIQSLILIGVTHIKQHDAHDDDLLLPAGSDYCALPGDGKTLLESGDNSPKKF
jgi:hypothetical protein